MGNTEKQIQDRVYLFLKQPSTSKNYDLETVVLPKINSVKNQILKGRYTSVFDEKTCYQCKRFDFLKVMKPYAYVQPSALTKPIVLGDNKVWFNTTGYPSSGSIIINNNVLTYNGITPDFITNVTGIQIDVMQGQVVRFLYPMPTDILRTFELFVYDWNLNSMEYQNDYEAPNKFNYYRILQNNTLIDVVYYPGGYINAQTFWLEYHHTTPDLILPEDEIILPGNYGIDVVAPIVAGELLWYYDQQERGSAILKSGYRSLNDMYSEFAQQIEVLKPKVDWKKPAYASVNYRYYNNWNNGSSN